MTREHEHEQTTSTKMPSAHLRRPETEDAWVVVQRALDGTRVPGLPGLVALLDDRQKSGVARRIRNLATVVSGEEMLAIADLVNIRFIDAIELALEVEIVELTPDALRAALMRSGELDARGDVIDPGTIREPAFAKIKARFGNASFLEALPGFLAPRRMMFINSHFGFIRWLVTSTPLAVVAEVMARYGEIGLASTLNRDKATLWSWVDHVQMGAASEPLWQLHHGCEHAPAKQVLANKLGATATMQNAKDRAAFHKAHAGDPAKVMASGTATRDQIFEAISHAGGLETGADRARLLEELVRLRANPDDILAPTYKAGIGSAKALELLLGAPRPTRDSIILLLFFRVSTRSPCCPTQSSFERCAGEFLRYGLTTSSR